MGQGPLTLLAHSLPELILRLPWPVQRFFKINRRSGIANEGMDGKGGSRLRLQGFRIAQRVLARCRSKEQRLLRKLGCRLHIGLPPREVMEGLCAWRARTDVELPFNGRIHPINV